MKLTGFQRLIKEDVPKEFQPLMDRIADSINNFADQVTLALNNNLTIEDNLNMEAKTIEVTVDGSGFPTRTTTFKSSLNGRVKGIVVSRAENLTSSTTYPTSCPLISYSENNGIITINHITGLTASNKFRLRLETRA